MSRYTDATYVVTGLFKAGRPVVCLTSRMVYEVDYLGSGWLVAEDAGFCCDLTSVPEVPARLSKLLIRLGLTWLLRAILRFRSYVAKRLARSSIVHDSCRQNPRRSKWWGDFVFLEVMGVDRVPMPLRIAAFVLALFNFGRD